MSEQTRLFLLAVGVDAMPESSELIDVQSAASGRETIATMRMVKVDLLLAGRAIPDMSMWTLIKRIRAARPDQKWAMIDSDINDAMEIQARSMGVMFICDTKPDSARLLDLSRSLLNRNGRCCPVSAEMFEATESNCRAAGRQMSLLKNAMMNVEDAPLDGPRYEAEKCTDQGMQPPARW